jgi:hypothetical protein
MFTTLRVGEHRLVEIDTHRRSVAPVLQAAFGRIARAVPSVFRNTLEACAVLGQLKQALQVTCGHHNLREKNVY